MPISPLAVATRGILTLSPLGMATRGYFVSLEGVIALVANLYGIGHSEASVLVYKNLPTPTLILGEGTATLESVQLLLATLLGEGFGDADGPHRVLEIQLHGVGSVETALEIQKWLQATPMGLGTSEGVLEAEKRLESAFYGLGMAETQLQVSKLLDILGIGASQAETEMLISKYLGSEVFGEGFIAPVYIVEFEHAPYGLVLHITRHRAMALER